MQPSIHHPYDSGALTPPPSARTHTSGVCNRSPGECSQMNSKPGARHVRACLALPLDWISPRSVRPSVREGRRRSIRRLVIAGGGGLKWGVNAETGRSPTEAAVVQLPSSASAQGRVRVMQLQPPASRFSHPAPRSARRIAVNAERTDAVSVFEKLLRRSFAGTQKASPCNTAANKAFIATACSSLFVYKVNLPC